MKKNNKVNPLKYFNDNKAMAYKKAGGAMKDFKKSLKRFQGDVTGSQVASDPASMASSDVRTNISSMNPMGTNVNEDNRKRMFDKGSLNPNNILREASERDRQLLENTPRNNQAAQARMNATISSTPRAAAQPVSKVDPSSYEQYKQQFNKKGGSVKKMSKGGSLKPVPSDKVGLSKLPTPVRNKMGYQKKGGSVKRK
jgi:hypothetical protein